jgi:predicted nucleotidyltransferase
VNPLAAALARVSADLQALDHRWALVGGFAVSARIEPRFTNDIDIAVAVAGDDEAERCTRALGAKGYQIVGSVDHDSGRLATVRLRRSVGDLVAVVDLLFASSGIEAEVVAAADVLEIVSGVHLPIASVGHLIALKVLARDDVQRPQDLADLRGLLATAGDDDLAVARAAARLIQQRGFHRDRDLPMLLDDLIASGR